MTCSVWSLLVDEATRGATSVKPLPPHEIRGLAWLAFAKRCIKDTSLTSWDPAAYTSAANQLAAQSPYAVSFVDVTIQVASSCKLRACDLGGSLTHANQPWDSNLLMEDVSCSLGAVSAQLNRPQ